MESQLEVGQLQQQSLRDYLFRFYFVSFPVSRLTVRSVWNLAGRTNSHVATTETEAVIQEETVFL